MTTGIQEVTRYVTDDGEEHKTLDEAEQYLAKLELSQALGKEFGFTLTGTAPIDVVTWLTENYNITPKA